MTGEAIRKGEMSGVYRDAEQFEELFTTLFARVQESDPGQLNDLVKRRWVVQFKVTEPEVEMWVDGRRAPVQVAFGPSSDKANYSFELSGESLHALMLGTLGLAAALSGRKVKMKGSKLQAMRLQSLFHALQSTYPKVAAELLDDQQ